MQSKHTEGKLPIFERWPSMLAILTGLALMIYLGTILITQYRNQVEARHMVNIHIVEETERLKATLEFYFDRCRKDVVTLANRLTESYTHATAIGVSVRNGSTNNTHDIKGAADNLMKTSRISGDTIFQRIRITNHNGGTIYDTPNIRPSPDVKNAILKTKQVPATDEALLALDKNLIITVPAIRGDKSMGHVMAWLDTGAIRRNFLAGNDGNCHVDSLVSNSGEIYFQDDLPKEILSCEPDEMELIPPETPFMLSAICDGVNPGHTDYLSIKLPIARTPASVVSFIPTSNVAGISQPWRHGAVMVALSATLVYFFVMQLRISRRNTALRTRYTEAHKQHAALVQSNEKLASEVILRKQAEAELKIINEHLEEIAKHRTQKLEDAMNDLRNTQSQLIQTGKLASIGELAAGIAHELNQPLMVIRGNAQFMARMIKKSEDATVDVQRDAQKDAKDQLPSFLETVERNTKRMNMIINHLRSFARQSGSELQSVDINQVVHDAFLMIGEQLRLHNIETVFKSAENLPPLNGNPYQLEQVVLNLLTNARDAIEAYQSVDKAYRRKKQICITTRLVDSGEDSVEMLFSDTGCGIQEEDKGKIFDPFFTTKAVGKGTGLGLSITYGIVQEHNGSLEIVETSPGHTTFRIVLPLQ